VGKTTAETPLDDQGDEISAVAELKEFLGLVPVIDVDARRPSLETSQQAYQPLRRVERQDAHMFASLHSVVDKVTGNVLGAIVELAVGDTTGRVDDGFSIGHRHRNPFEEIGQLESVHQLADLVRGRPRPASAMMLLMISLVPP
jgi:hypothetical protein